MPLEQRFDGSNAGGAWLAQADATPNARRADAANFSALLKAEAFCAHKQRSPGAELTFAPPCTRIACSSRLPLAKLDKKPLKIPRIYSECTPPGYCQTRASPEFLC